MVRTNFYDRHPAGLIAMAFVAALIAMLLSYFQTTRWNPEMRFWKAAAVAKSDWVESLRSSDDAPIVICLGGSATGFGIDAEYANRGLDCRLVNLGLHAGMGAEVLIGFALSKARKGDTLLVMLEPELLADSEMETALGVQFAYAIGEPEILDWHDSSTSFHSTDLRPGASNVFGVIGKIVMGRPLYRYQVKDLREGGLLTTSVTSRIVGRKSSPETLSESAQKLLKDLVAIARERGYKVVYGFPWVYSDEENVDTVRQGRSRLLKAIEEIMPVIHEENLGVSTEVVDFRDSPQHLSDLAARKRTVVLVEALEKHLAVR